MSRRLAATLAIVAATVPVAATVILHDRGDGDAQRVPSTLGPTRPATTIRFELTLRMNDRAFAQAASARANPASPTFEQTLSASAIGRRFGLPLSSIDRLRRMLAVDGITVVRTYPQRTAVDVRASVATLHRVFGISYRDHIDPHGVRYHAPTGRARLPLGLTPFVHGVVGLSTRLIATANALRQGALVPGDAALAYDVSPLASQHINGNGLTIAVASFQAFDDTDVAYYRRRFEIDGPKPRHLASGAPGVSGHDEANLDVEIVSAIAPRAQIVEYEAAPSRAGWVAILNAIAASKASMASLSWGMCDSSGLDPGTRSAMQRALATLAIRGITLFVASGDGGAYDCQADSFSDTRPTVDFPGDSASVVSVGGTLLSVRTDGTYLGEVAWDGPLSNSGGGGGIDAHDAAPAWQRTQHVGDGRHRVVPDVSASASPGSGWAIWIGGDWHVIGGTSAAAPFWAASMLLAQQYADRGGSPRRCFLAPILYALAFGKVPYAPFHDVTAGRNRLYQAHKGWDYATGLGSPDVYNLARDLGGVLKTLPKACAA